MKGFGRMWSSELKQQVMMMMIELMNELTTDLNGESVRVI